jgi:hypothetical protein
VYRDIPVPSWQVVYPDKLLQFRPLDLLRLDLFGVAGATAALAQAKYNSIVLQVSGHGSYHSAWYVVAPTWCDSHTGLDQQASMADATWQSTPSGEDHSTASQPHPAWVLLMAVIPCSK